MLFLVKRGHAVVQFGMIHTSTDQEIAVPVICFVAIDVMNHLAGTQSPLKYLFGDKNVLSTRNVWSDSTHDVAGRIDVPATFPGIMLGAASIRPFLEMARPAHLTATSSRSAAA